MKIKRNLVNSKFYCGKRSVGDIQYIVVKTIDNNSTTHYHIYKGEAIQKIPDEYMSDATNGCRMNKYGRLHGICTKYNSVSVGVPCRMSLEDKQSCYDLVMALKQRYRIDNDNIIRQFDITGEANPEEWHDAMLWDRDIKNKLIDV